MKRFAFCILLLMLLFTMGGCNDKDLPVTLDDVSNNTMLVKKNGTLQVAFVEAFDKEYYQLSELDEFVKQEVNAYNEKAGAEEIKIDNVLLRDGNAIVILTFSGMAHYSAFNNISAAFFSTSTKDVAIQLPDRYIEAKKQASVSREEAFKSGKNKALVLYEPYDVIVEGSIKYYSENLTLADKNKVEGNEGDITVVIYKP